MPKFTDKFIANLKPHEKDYWVREGMGFAVRVYPTGAKIWYYIYTFGTKKFMRLKDGGYPEVSLADARKEYEAAKVKVNNGIDPQEEKRQKDEDHKAAPTVKDLASDYMKKHARKNKRASSADEDQRLLDKDVLPVWGDRKAKDIRKRDVIKLLEDVAERGNALCHNVFKLVRKMYNFAIERDILETTPCLGVKIDNIAPTMARDRVLKEPKDNNGVDEILTFWIELEKAAMAEDTKRALKLILVTGQRPGEVAGIHSREIEGRWWTIPVARRKVKEKSKNPPQPHRVYLTDMALELIGDKEGYKYPSPKIVLDDNEQVIESHINDTAISHAVRRNLKSCTPKRPIKGDTIKMVKVAESSKMNIEEFIPHDLRRTCSTRLAALGYKDEINDAILGHVKEGVIGIYNRYQYDREKEEAMKAWEQALTNITATND